VRRLLLLLPLLAVALFGSARAGEHKEREFQECTDCPVMVGIPAGAFTMGSAARETGHFDNEGPQHAVNVRAFAIGKFDVTNEQFLRFLQETGYKPAPCNSILDFGWKPAENGFARPPTEVAPPNWPAVCVAWKDAQAYIAWLNTKAKAAHPGASGTYRLPTEAEWEYAARGGTATARWWGDELGSNNANCNGCGSTADARVLTDVDAFAANPFGLYGVLGNAWQWTTDCWHPDYRGAPHDGGAWTSGGDCTRHVLRGGSWTNIPLFIRSAARTGAPAVRGEYDYSSLAGFRVVRTLP